MYIACDGHVMIVIHLGLEVNDDHDFNVFHAESGDGKRARCSDWHPLSLLGSDNLLLVQQW